MDWLKTMHDKKGHIIGHFRTTCSDFQNQNGTFITSQPSANDILQRRTHEITINNFLQIAIAFAVRMCIEATWYNDRDQFLYPDDGWERDAEFQADCLVYALFHGQNRISANVETCHGASLQANHWIPFTEEEVGAPDCFASHFMTDFMAGKHGDACVSQAKTPQQGDLFADVETADVASDNAAWTGGHAPLSNAPLPDAPLSNAASVVMAAGREVWRYYMRQPGINVNASLYDIKAFFKGRDEKGRMNATSPDEHFNTLMENLRVALQELAKQIETKVYAYGFLK